MRVIFPLRLWGLTVAVAFCFAWSRAICTIGFNARRISDAALNYCNECFFFFFGIALDSLVCSLDYSDAFSGTVSAGEFSTSCNIRRRISRSATI